MKEVTGFSDASMALAQQRETHSQNHAAEDTTSSWTTLLYEVVKL